MKTIYWMTMALVIGMWPAMLNAGDYYHHGRGGHRSHVYFSFGIGHNGHLGVFYNHYYRPGHYYRGFKRHYYRPYYSHYKRHSYYRGYKSYGYHGFKKHYYRTYNGHYKRHSYYRFKHHPRHHHFKHRSFGHYYKYKGLRR